jgi:hypothetical protein
MIAELGKLNSLGVFDESWPNSRFSYNDDLGMSDALVDFVDFQVLFRFASTASNATAIRQLQELSQSPPDLAVFFREWLNDEMGVYADKYEWLGEVLDLPESEKKATSASAQFKENFQEQLLNAVTQDSGNRAQMVLDYFDNNLGPLVDEFGMDGTELIFEILTILSQQEKERLGETSTPEEKLNLDDLDFLDSDDEEFSLIDLEEDADEFEI